VASLLCRSERQFLGNSAKKTAENTVKHHDGGVGLVVAKHRSGGKGLVVVTTLPLHMLLPVLCNFEQELCPTLVDINRDDCY